MHVQEQQTDVHSLDVLVAGMIPAAYGEKLVNLGPVSAETMVHVKARQLGNIVMH